MSQSTISLPDNVYCWHHFPPRTVSEKGFVDQRNVHSDNFSLPVRMHEKLEFRHEVIKTSYTAIGQGRHVTSSAFRGRKGSRQSSTVNMHSSSQRPDTNTPRPGEETATSQNLHSEPARLNKLWRQRGHRRQDKATVPEGSWFQSRAVLTRVHAMHLTLNGVLSSQLQMLPQLPCTLIYRISSTPHPCASFTEK